MENKQYEFYDPHPGGISGAIVPLPTHMKSVADSLNGKTITLEEAVEKIGEGARVIEKYNFIMYVKNSGTATHSWRLIRYKELEE